MNFLIYTVDLNKFFLLFFFFNQPPPQPTIKNSVQLYIYRLEIGMIEFRNCVIENALFFFDKFESFPKKMCNLSAKQRFWFLYKERKNSYSHVSFIEYLVDSPLAD